MIGLERLAGARAVVVGDVMLDEHVWGDVTRISPEAPVPVVDVRRRTHIPGAAANVAAGIKALGGEVALGGVVGVDRGAKLLTDELSARSIRTEGLLRVSDRCTTTKLRVIAHSQQVVRVDEEKRRELAPEEENALRQWVATEIADADVVVLSDYAKGVITRSLAASVIGLARQARKPVVVDPKGSDYDRFQGATVLTPNLEEARRAAGVAPNLRTPLAQLRARLRHFLEDSALLVTLGSDGMVLFDSDQVVEVRSDAREVFDVTGAGDTVVAMLAVALGRGLGLADAVRLSNAAAGIAVGKVGTATVSLAELSTRLAEH